MIVSVKDRKIESFSAVKGCSRNLAAIGKLLPGMEVTRVIELLDDNYCSGAPLAGYTSCMDNAKKVAKQKIAFVGHVCSRCGLLSSFFLLILNLNYGGN